MANKIYKDKQRYRDRVVLGLLGLTSISLLAIGLRALVVSPVNYTYGLVALGLSATVAGLVYLLLKLRLKVRIDDRGIKYRLAPLQRDSQRIPWDEVKACSVVKTPPAAQWHGANLSFGAEKKVALNGRNGLQLVTNTGRRVFVGVGDLDRLCKKVDRICTVASA